MRSRSVFVVLSLLATLAGAAQEEIPEALRAMAETEREFARAATVKGVRDAFLEFFADDSVALTPKPVPAKEGLRKQQARPFSDTGIIWEPRTGDVSGSGEIGWLTGPATFTAGADAKPTGYGCYLSIWRKQPDGRWRVFIDIGASAPVPVTFAPGFTRTTIDRPYRGNDSPEAATAHLLEADRMLNERIAAQGAATAFAGVLITTSRFHRPGRVPIVGRESVLSWLGSDTVTLTAETGAGEAARSSDFGYTYGLYHKDAAAPESRRSLGEGGPYVRVWSRDASGRWWLMVDVAR